MPPSRKVEQPPCIRLGHLKEEGQVMYPQMEERLARERLDEARAAAARRALIRELRPARRPVRETVGYALIKVGHWLAARKPSAPSVRGGRVRPRNPPSASSVASSSAACNPTNGER